jgi:hypothetical protein
MGLLTWRGESVRKADVTVAKNYLREEEISELNRIVTMWLDFAEDQARRRKQVFLRDWESRLDEFLRFNDRSVLTNAGSVSTADAHAHAEDDTPCSPCSVPSSRRRAIEPPSSRLRTPQRRLSRPEAVKGRPAKKS